MNGVFVVGRYGFDRDAAADRSRQSAIGYNVERDGKIVGTVADVRCAFLSGVGLDASVEQVMKPTPSWQPLEYRMRRPADADASAFDSSIADCGCRRKGH